MATAQDQTSGPVQVLGLKQTSENFQNINGPMKLRIGRAAALQGALIINSAVKLNTYRTFRRITGMIQSGFGVRVAKKLDHDNVLNTFVVQYPQQITGGSDIAVAFRKQYLRVRPRARSVSIKPHIAYWWRFLEFGTGPRFSKKKPSFLRRGLAPRSKADWSSLHRFAQAGYRGADRKSVV